MLDNLRDTWQRFAEWDSFSFAGRELSVRTILAALAFFAVGVMLAKFIGRWLRRRLFKLDTISESTAELSARWTAYLVAALFLGAALWFVGVPMTAFSFLGGAVALGFGFGAQNLCSNVISGIIILATRPFRRGDIVEVNGQVGIVHIIGLRATEVTTYDGIHLLVPNSVFLQNVIVNRTNRERALRGTVSVAVAYDSDTRQVAEILRKAAAANPAILQSEDKAPWVLFEDFQDSGLLFRVYFWADIKKQGVPATSSELRHAINAALKDAGITIPYPRLEVSMRPPAAP